MSGKRNNVAAGNGGEQDAVPNDERAA